MQDRESQFQQQQRRRNSIITAVPQKNRYGPSAQNSRDRSNNPTDSTRPPVTANHPESSNLQHRSPVTPVLTSLPSSGMSELPSRGNLISQGGYMGTPNIAHHQRKFTSATRNHHLSPDSQGGHSSSQGLQTRMVGKHVVVTPAPAMRQKMQLVQPAASSKMSNKAEVTSLGTSQSPNKNQIDLTKFHKPAQLEQFKWMYKRKFILDLDNKAIDQRSTQMYQNFHYDDRINKILEKISPLKKKPPIKRDSVMLSSNQKDNKIQHILSPRMQIAGDVTFHPAISRDRSPSIKSEREASFMREKRVSLPASWGQRDNSPFVSPRATAVLGSQSVIGRPMELRDMDDASMLRQLNMSMSRDLVEEVAQKKRQHASEAKKRHASVSLISEALGIPMTSPRSDEASQKILVEVEENSSLDETASHIKLRTSRLATETKGSKLSLMETHQLFSDAEESACLDTIMDKVGRPELEAPVNIGGIAGNVEPYVVVEGTDDDFNFRDFNQVKKNIRMNVIREYQEEEKKKIVEEARLAAIKAEKDAGRDPFRKMYPKRPPLKRKRSFTECQTKYDDGIALKQAMRERMKGKNPAEMYTLDQMKTGGKFPISEALLARPESFELNIDSLINYAFNMMNVYRNALEVQELAVPQNSEETEEEIDLAYSSGDEIVPAHVVVIKDPMARFKVIDERVFDIQNFEITTMRDFPHRYREGDIPYKILKLKKLDQFGEIQTKIAGLFDGIKYPEDYLKKGKHFDPKIVQLIFEYYCLELKAGPIPLTDFMQLLESGWYTLKLKNYQLNESVLKAIACTIPFMVNVKDIEFESNAIHDLPCCALILACYMNPSIETFKVNGNHLRAASVNTMNEMVKHQPSKLQSLSLAASYQHVDNIERFASFLEKYTKLLELSLAGNTMSLNACKVVGRFIVFDSKCIRELNLAHCKIGYQGTRYIVNAMNRNTTMRYFNFSFNDMQSANFEFSIKMGAIITRHPNLMHCDLTNVGLKREEVIFIGLALSNSKTMLALHLTANDLPYYDRVFLRSLIAARVGFRYKEDPTKLDIENNKEYDTVMHLAGGGNYNPQIQDYIHHYNKLDQEREGLDFEIQELLDDMDVEHQFEAIEKGADITGFNPESKLGRLFTLMKDRELAMARQKKAIEKAANDNPEAVNAGLNKIKDMKKMNVFNQTKQTEQTEQSGEEKQATNAFEMQGQLKVDRQRARVEREIGKDGKRSQGEMALMFMGINQIANQLLKENPMVGYMGQVVFSRVLGCDEIEQGHYWLDCNQCWICQQWAMLQIRLHPDDRSLFTDKIERLEMLLDTVKKTVEKAVEKEILLDDQVEKLSDISESELDQGSAPRADTSLTRSTPNLKKPMPNSPRQTPDRESPPGMMQKISNNQEKKEQNFLSSGAEEKNLKESVMDKIQEEEIDGQTAGRGSPVDTIGRASKLTSRMERSANNSPVEGMSYLTDRNHKNRIADMNLNTENPIAPRPVKKKDIKKKIFPEQFKAQSNFKELDPSHAVDPGVYDVEGKGPVEGFSKLLALQGINKRNSVSQKGGRRQKDSDDSDTQNEENKSDGFREVGEPEEEKAIEDDLMSQVTSVTKITKRVHGAATLIERQVFFKGMVYIIEEEVYSDSGCSSVYSSEDDFEDDRGICKRFALKFPLLNMIDDDQDAKFDGGSSGDTISEQSEQSKVSWPSYMRLAVDGFKKNQRGGKPGDQSRAQKEYQNKLLPKHYIERLKDQRVEKFEVYESEDAQKILQKKNRRNKRRLQRKLREQAEANNMSKVEMMMQGMGSDEDLSVEEKANDTFFVSSCCDWMPQKMKTKRRLAIEKLPMHEPAPSTILNIDNTELIYANMVSPGFHYFYFVQGVERCFLSPKYEVVRFKDTNVLLNRVEIKSKVHVFESAFVIKDGQEDEELFLIDHSIFNRYEVEQMPKRTELIFRGFETDTGFSKLIRVCKTDQAELDRVKAKLWEHYHRIQNIFLFEIGRNDKAHLGQNDWLSFARKTGIFDNKIIDLATLDRTFILTNVNTHGLFSSAERNLNRYEFIEILVRFANIKYKEKSHQAKTTCEAIEMMLQKNVYPNCRECDGWQFRQKHLYNVQVNTFLKRNFAVIEKIYRTPHGTIECHSKKKFVTLPECKQYIHKMNIKGISERMVGVCFYESILFIVDTIRTGRYEMMQYWEFIVFICRITYEFYKKTPYHNEPFHLKLDQMLPLWLAPVYQTRAWSFEEEFQYDVKMRKKRERQARRDAGIDSDGEGDSDDYDSQDMSSEDRDRLAAEELAQAGLVQDGDVDSEGNPIAAPENDSDGNPINKEKEFDADGNEIKKEDDSDDD